MIQRINVTSPKAFDYLRSQLSLGGDFLSRNILKLTLEQGNVFAFVPEGTSNDALFRFESGGLYMIDRSLQTNPTVIPVQDEDVPIIVNVIHEFLGLDTSNCCIFEEPNARPSNPGMINSGEEYVTIGDEIFYFIDHKNNDVNEIQRILINSETYYLLGVLTSLADPYHDDFMPFKEINSELLEMAARNVKTFFATAYDNEAYLMWTRRET